MHHNNWMLCSDLLGRSQVKTYHFSQLHIGRQFKIQFKWFFRRSEQRMRQHASKQNAIPNNMRIIPPPPSKPIATKDTNKHRTSVQVPEAASRVSNVAVDQQVTNNQNAIALENVSGNSRSDSGVAVSVENNTRSIEPPPLPLTPPPKLTSPKTSRIKDARDVKAKRNEWRITKMVLAIFLSFVMCYLPITVAKIADSDVTLPALHIIGYILLYLSSCINPIIYVIMNKQYRQAYKTVILCKPGRLLSFTHAGSSMGGKRFMIYVSWYIFCRTVARIA